MLVTYDFIIYIKCDKFWIYIYIKNNNNLDFKNYDQKFKFLLYVKRWKKIFFIDRNFLLEEV